MHYLIENIIGSFTSQELREFNYFLERRPTGQDERRDILMVDQIRRGDITTSGNVGHQTRKRLKVQLESYLQYANINHDERSQIMNQVEVARFLFRKGLYKEAWFYLERAASVALEAEEYALLGFIYDTQIYYALDNSPIRMPALFIPELLNKKAENALLIARDADANAAYLLILYEISESFNKKVYGDIDALIQRVLKKYNLETRIYDSPKIYVKVVNIVCRAFREKKDYQSLKRYSVSSFQAMKKQRILDKIPPEFLLDLLRSVYQSSTRTKDFKTAMQFQGIYNLQKERFHAQHDKYIYFDFRSQIMLSDLHLFAGDLKEAKPILMKLKQKYQEEERNLVVYFLLRVNLLVMHFILKEYDTCISIYSDMIQQFGKEVLKTEGLGLEQLFFTEIVGAICYYEKEDEEYALHLLTKVKRKFLISGKQKHSLEREAEFVRIFEKLIKNKAYLKSKKFESDVDHFTSLKEYIPGDKEFISLNAWLSSKQTGRQYYDCFLESVGK
jgi:hypothetical protein